MTPTSHNSRAAIEQYENNKELKRLRQVYKKNTLTTTQIKLAIACCTRNIDPAISPPDIRVQFPKAFRIGDWV